MEKLKIIVLIFLLLSNLGCLKKNENKEPNKTVVAPNIKINSNMIDTFYDGQFQCDKNAEKFKITREEKDPNGDLNADIWAIVSDFKTTEIAPDPKNEFPHRRFRLHYLVWAVFSCGGGMLEGPKNYEEAKKPYDIRDAIIRVHINDKGLGLFSRVDVDETHKEGMNLKENGMSYLNYGSEGLEKPNCVSKLEDLLSGKTTVDLDKLCAYMAGEPRYKERYAKTKADLDRLMGYWKQAAQEKEKVKGVK